MTRLLNNNKALIFIIAVLLIANITLLVFFFTMKPAHQGRQRTSEFLKREIGFSEEQLKQYDTLKKAHWKVMKPMIKSMNATKDSFYAYLKEPTIDSTLMNALSDRIALMQKNLDWRVFTHFRNTRGLCTPAQKPLYDSLVQDVIRKMVSPNRKPESRASGHNQDNK